MKLTVKSVSTKNFVMMFASINFVAGIVIGLIVTIVSLLSPPEESGRAGVWAFLVFPIVNGLLGLASGAFLTGIYNLLAKYLGGVQIECDQNP